MLINKQRLNSRLIAVLVIAGTAVATFMVYAAFIEPLAGPGSSSQDSAQNILGANNAKNAFDSSAVTANNNGSIIERLEYIQSQLK